MNRSREVKIGLTGPCGSGKTTLKNILNEYGYTAVHIAQEHSYVQDMWKKITDPDLLVYLKVSFEETKSRKGYKWTEAEYESQIHRLKHARQNADLVIDTDNHPPAEIASMILRFINSSPDDRHRSVSGV